MAKQQVLRQHRMAVVLMVIFISTLFTSVFPKLVGLSWAETQGNSDRTLSPYFFVESKNGGVDHFPLKETQVTVNINGVIADVIVNQTYANTGLEPLNARYIFPASTRAAVHGMNMIIGDQVITAKIKEKKQAEKTFNEAKKAGKSASLLQQQRPNVFSMNVANIMPGDRVEVELKYTELLVPTEGTYEFVYPTVVGPRYSGVPEATAPESDQWVKNPYLKNGSDRPADPTHDESDLFGNKPALPKFNIAISLSTGIPLKAVGCTTHETETIWEGDQLARVVLAEGNTDNGNRDYILQYRLADREIQSGLMLSETDAEKFFLLMVEPPERVLPEHLPSREYVFVVDVSGSMNGFPLNTAKKLLRDLIGNLKQTDRFNLILFAGAAQVMAPTSLAATPANIQHAIRILDNQRGGGGTELASALKKGLQLPRAEGISRTMVVVTDGYISAEKEAFELIRSNLNRTNVFAFGIGSSVNRYLIEGVAKAGLGEPFVVVDPQQAPEAAERFRQYISAPVLTGIDVSFDGFDAYSVEPATVPDLFAQRPILVYGKWRGEAKGSVTITGTDGSGPFRRTFNVADSPPLPSNNVLQYLWARKRIALLTDFNFVNGQDEAQAEITSLGLTYHLLTPFTSFVAVHDVVRNPEGKGRDVKQPLPLPKNVSNLAVGGGMAQVPEPEIMAIFLIFAGWLIMRYGYRRFRTPRYPVSKV